MSWEIAVALGLSMIWGVSLGYFRRRFRHAYAVTLVVGFGVLLAWGFFGIAKIQNHGWRPVDTRSLR
jgi:hypothetical protein